MSKIAPKVPQNNSENARVSGGVHEQRQWAQVVYTSNATVPGGVHEQRHNFLDPGLRPPAVCIPGKYAIFMFFFYQ